MLKCGHRSLPYFCMMYESLLIESKKNDIWILSNDLSVIPYWKWMIILVIIGLGKQIKARLY